MPKFIKGGTHEGLRSWWAHTWHSLKKHMCETKEYAKHQESQPETHTVKVSLCRQDIIWALRADIDVLVPGTNLEQTALAFASVLLSTVRVTISHCTTSVRFLWTLSNCHLLTARIHLAFTVCVQKGLILTQVFNRDSYFAIFLVSPSFRSADGGAQLAIYESWLVSWLQIRCLVIHMEEAISLLELHRIETFELLVLPRVIAFGWWNLLADCRVGAGGMICRQIIHVWWYSLSSVIYWRIISGL